MLSNFEFNNLSALEKTIRAAVSFRISSPFQLGQLAIADYSQNKDDTSHSKAFIDLAKRPIKKLDISQNTFLSNKVTLFCTLIQYGTLIKLKLAHLEINDKGAYSIAQCLQVNSQLKSLDLSSNKFKNEGFKHIADSLVINKSLRKLSKPISRFEAYGIDFS